MKHLNKKVQKFEKNHKLQVLLIWD
jgi:hypothetical protein